MKDFQTFNEEQKARWQRRMERHSRHGHLWTGFFILLIGVTALLKATVPDFPDWVFSWQTLLIAMGFFIGVRHGFKGSAWFILMIIGGVFLLNDIYPELTFRRYMWPLALILVGLFIILRPRRRYQWHWEEDQKKSTGSANISGATVTDETHNSKEDYVEATSIFGGTKKNIISKNFRGGDLVSIFGGTELDLSQADFTDTAVIELTTIFGGTKLIVPSNWEVKSEAVTIFGGIEDKRKMQVLKENPEKTLLLRGTVLFGGIDIKSY